MHNRDRNLMGGFGASSKNKTIAVIYRILGNDLPPRHDERQTVRNLEFILQHEPQHEGLQRAWVVNRILCTRTERQVLDLLDAARERYLYIACDLETYSRITPNFSHFEAEDYALLWSGKAKDGYHRILAHDHAFHAQNTYLMNVNGARNVAISDGLSRAAWVLPWDGNCFLTADAWSEIRAACEGAGEKWRYLIVPMERLLDNADLFRTEAPFQALEEPQVAIHADAAEWFDEALRYGRFSKVELLRRIGVPGVWDTWHFQRWERRGWKRSPDYGAWRYCGWVPRLASGRPDFDRDPTAAGIRHRSLARRASIRGAVTRADRVLVARALERGPSFLDLCIMDSHRHASLERPADSAELVSLLAKGEAALGQPIRTVLQKTRCAPNGDWRTYHSVAPFWWPDPMGPDLPYVRHDGQRVPEAQWNREESSAYDTTRLQGVFEDVFALAWSYHISSRVEFANKAVAVLDAWFCDTRTGMRANLDYAQVRRGHQPIGGQPSGIIDARDIYLLLDGIMCLRRAGQLPKAADEHFRDWCDEYLEWLLGSPFGLAECAATNNHATCYEIQVLALSLFLGRTDSFVESANRARSRVFSQFGEDGRQTEEARRRTALHYALFNLQSWMVVARLLEIGGLRLAAPGGPGAQRLTAAVNSLMKNVALWRLEIAAVQIWPARVAARLGTRIDAICAGAAHFGLGFRVCAPVHAQGVWPHHYTGVPPLWPLAFPYMRDADPTSDAQGTMT